MPGLLALVVMVGAAASAGAQESTSCTVESITDGDTIRCDGERVRLLTIDAPEDGQGPF